MGIDIPLFDQDDGITEGVAVYMAFMISQQTKDKAQRQGVVFRCAHAGGRKPRKTCVGWEGAGALIALWPKGAWGCVGCGLDVRRLKAEGESMWNRTASAVEDVKADTAKRKQRAWRMTRG